MDMELWQIIVALLQGLVEWLPISSEGQVVLFLYNLGTVPTDELISLVVWLHLGTTLAVLVRYPRRILDILTLRDRALFKLLLIATVCTAVTAIPLYTFLRSALTSPVFGEVVNILIGGLLLVTAVVLYLPTRTTTKSADTEREPSDREAAVTGIIQGFSILPGISRSGVTVSSLLMQRVDKQTALEFSFLMSIPAVIGIMAVELLYGEAAIPSISTVDLLLMEVIVFVTGLASMEFLLRVAKHVQFWMLCLFLGTIAILFGLPALF